MSHYVKYHGLGNDYLVIEPGWFNAPMTPERIRLICDRHKGIGSDGILYGPLDASDNEGLSVKIFNPDGSEAQKSGNGLRIFARHLWDGGHLPRGEIVINTRGGQVRARESSKVAGAIDVEMGKVRFNRAAIPMTGPDTDALLINVMIDGRILTINGAGIGNPHCVVLVENPTPELAMQYGPRLEAHPWFPERTNVQFMRILDKHAIRIEIWERGAGYTSASGSSSCAAAAVACRLGFCRSPVAVHMPGGALQVALNNYCAVQTGTVEAVGSGTFSGELLAKLLR